MLLICLDRKTLGVQEKMHQLMTKRPKPAGQVKSYCVIEQDGFGFEEPLTVLPFAVGADYVGRKNYERAEWKIIGHAHTCANLEVDLLERGEARRTGIVVPHAQPGRAGLIVVPAVAIIVFRGRLPTRCEQQEKQGGDVPIHLIWFDGDGYYRM